MSVHVRFFVLVGGLTGYYGRGETLAEAEKNCRRAAGRNWGRCKRERLSRFMATASKPFSDGEDGDVQCFPNDFGGISYSTKTVTLRNLDEAQG